MGEIQPDAGEFKWSENSNLGYYAQDHSSDFVKDQTLMEWMSQWMKEGNDDSLFVVH